MSDTPAARPDTQPPTPDTPARSPRGAAAVTVLSVTLMVVLLALWIGGLVYVLIRVL